MKKIASLHPNKAMPTLAHCYRDAIADGFNRIVDVGHFDAPTSNCMIGFLAAAAIAFKCPVTWFMQKYSRNQAYSLRTIGLSSKKYADLQLKNWIK